MDLNSERPIGVSDALEVLRPGSKWYCHQNQVEGLTWLSENIERPSDEEILQKIEELKVQKENTEYQRQRAPEYPSIGDQLDALFHAGVFPPEMAAQIQAIKDKYPKPE